MCVCKFIFKFNVNLICSKNFELRKLKYPTKIYINVIRITLGYCARQCLKWPQLSLSPSTHPSVIPFPQVVWANQFTFVYSFFSSIFIEVQLTNKNYICLRCRAWCLDTHTCSKMKFVGRPTRHVEGDHFAHVWGGLCLCSHSLCPFSYCRMSVL